jgi:hypothetical protein
VPSEDLLPLLPDLKSGKLAPAPDFGKVSPPSTKKNDPNLLVSESGKLDDMDPSDRVRKGCKARPFTVKLAAGDRVTIDLASNEFDAYLRLEDSKGKQLAEDDDSGGDLNARIVFRAPRDDTYRIIATTCNPGESGRFTLTVRKMPDEKK